MTIDSPLMDAFGLVANYEITSRGQSNSKNIDDIRNAFRFFEGQSGSTFKLTSYDIGVPNLDSNTLFSQQ